MALNVKSVLLTIVFVNAFPLESVKVAAIILEVTNGSSTVFAIEFP